MITPEVFFTWLRVYPTIAVQLGPLKAVVPDDKFIIMASEITPQEWNAYFAGLRETFGIVAVILLILAGASWRFFISRQQAQSERDRFFNLTRDMLCIAGFDGYFKRVNPAWTNTLGYTREEMLSKPFLEFVHPDDRERTVAESATLALGGETFQFENRYLSKDGSYRWLLWSARSLVSEKLIFASARDLTERKAIEEQILKLNDEMKHRADDLEIANKELEAFSYSVSHDLRAPLRHINGFVELLQKSPAIQAEESSSRQMRVIARAAKNMGMLIDDLLAFSRTGRAEMHLIPVDTRELVDQVIRDLEMETKNRKIAWDINSLPRVSVDPPLFRLVWANLIANAIKYTRPRDEAKIEIGYTSEKTLSKQEIVFYIRDNGVGFDMQYASKLFGVFQRLHRAADFEGTGIGLANVQRIVHRHGGRVWAEAAINSGATFYFSIPVTLNHGNSPWLK